ncbi:MAG: hypothetical protein ABW168_08860 [Sedimenticola sp.]
MEKQMDEFRKKVEIERKRVEKMEKETTDMCFYGLWQSSEQVESELIILKSKKEKEEALKAQLRFRKNVFKQKPPSASTYNFSHLLNGKRINLTVDQLTENVKKLIQKSFENPSSDSASENETILIGKTVKHKYIERDGQDKWYIGKVISQVL